MRKALLSLAVVGGLSALLLAAAPPPSSNAPIPEVLAELRQIEGAALRNAVDPLRFKYTEAARARPNDPMMRVYLAWCELPREEAWNQLKAIAPLHPDNPWVRWGMGRMYLRWKMKDQAKVEFDEVLKKNPSFYPAITGLGLLARSKGDTVAAQAQFEAALKVADDAEARAGLGLIWFEQGQKEKAAESLKKGIELWQDQPEPLEVLAGIYRQANDMPSAIKVAAVVADLNPKDRKARRTVADLRFDNGQKAEAAADYERLQRLGNPEPDMLRRLSGLYRELGNTEAEERTLQQLAALDKTDSEAPRRLSQLASSRDAGEVAEGQLLEAIDRAPDRGELKLELARERVRREALYEALESYRQAMTATDAAVADAAKKEGEELSKKFKLPAKQAKGSVEVVYTTVAKGLNEFYLERKRKKPSLAGELKVRVRIDKSGVVKGVDMVSDTVGDPLLAGHVFFALYDATYPKQKREPVFEFELGKKGK
ncbi:MAG: tetratricopeptide repeat protein [Myxococcaceae bacterium]|nr:tetratricopeptide repeat protein [Myxococcaceae bacterium]